MINIIKYKKIDLKFVGMGGMPSTHTSIATAPLTLCVLDEGFDTPIIGIGVAFLLITIIDALDLRKKISHHAKLINSLLLDKNRKTQLRENINHKFIEIIGGIFSGMFAGYLLYYINETYV